MTTQTVEPQPLTDRQREVLDFVVANIGLYSPTVREIAAEFGWKSPNAVTVHLDALEKKGWIRRTHGVRGIEVLHGTR